MPDPDSTHPADRHPRLPAILAAVAVAATASLPSPTRAGVDLWVEPAAVDPISFETMSDKPCAVVEGCLAEGTRLIMRFGNEFVNRGTADLVVGVAPPDGESDSVFVWDTCHGHHHLRQIMTYELVDAANVVAVGRKVNFCMADSEPWAPDANPTPVYACGTVQGLQRGWGDIYTPDFDCQWLDITGVPSGTYTLRLTVDPLNRYPEDDETNNVTLRQVEIPASAVVGVAAADTRGPGLELLGQRPEVGAEAVRVTLGPQGGAVSLTVHDLRGALRRTLLRSDLPAHATETVRWGGTDDRGRGLPAGVYFVRLRTPGPSMSRAVLVFTGSR